MSVGTGQFGVDVLSLSGWLKVRHNIHPQLRSTGDPRKDTHSSATVHSVSMWLWSSWCQDTTSHLSLWKTPKYLTTPCWQSFGKSYSHMAEGGQSGINLWKKRRQNLPKLHNAYMLCPNNSTFRNSSKVHLIHIRKSGYQRGSLQPTLWE